MTRPVRRRELAGKAVATKGVGIALACRTFGVSETCFRYSPKRGDENEVITGLLNNAGWPPPGRFGDAKSPAGHLRNHMA